MFKKQSGKVLNAGIIGFGGMAGYHLGKMRKSKGFNVVAAYDIDPARLEAAKKAGLRACNSAEELLSDPSIDLVLVATPNNVHEEYVIMCANAKKHVICEKPVTLSSASLERMEAAARENGIVFMVHQNRRWDKDYLKVKEVVNHGKIGNVYKIESNVVGSHGVPGAWRKDKAAGGGMIWDWGVHLIDQILTMRPDNKVVGIYCRTSFVWGLEVDDGLNLFIDFDDGFTANVVIDTNTFVKLPRWVVYGTDGTAIVKDWSNRGRQIAVKVFEDVHNKGIEAGNGFTKTMASRSANTVKKYRLPKVKVDGLVYYNHLYDSIVNHADRVISYESVLRCMRVMEACFESSEKKQRVEVDI